jgi:hypothetical protein
VTAPMPRDGVRECGCPAWVLPCVQFGGQVVYVVSSKFTGWYEVHGPTTILVESEDPKIRRHSGCEPTHSRDYASAEADFHRHEKELRAGG